MTRGALSSSHFCMRSITRARPAKPRASQPGCAARPRFAIARTSSADRSGTWATISPVAGFSTGTCPAWWPFVVAASGAAFSSVPAMVDPLQTEDWLTGQIYRVHRTGDVIPTSRDERHPRRRIAAARLLERDRLDALVAGRLVASV